MVNRGRRARQVTASAALLALLACAPGCLDSASAGERDAPVGDPASSKTLPEPQRTGTMDELYERIQAQTLDMVGEGYRHALPVPVLQQGALRVQVMLCPSILRAPEGAQLLPPDQLATYDWSRQSLVEMRSVKPADFGRSDPVDRVMGTANLPSGMTVQDYEEKRARVFRALDVLLPAYASARRRPSEAERGAAREFREVFWQIAEPPLQPYYRHLLRDFSDWLAALER